MVDDSKVASVCVSECSDANDNGEAHASTGSSRTVNMSLSWLTRGIMLTVVLGPASPETVGVGEAEQKYPKSDTGVVGKV